MSSKSSPLVTIAFFIPHLAAAITGLERSGSTPHGRSSGGHHPTLRTVRFAHTSPPYRRAEELRQAGSPVEILDEDALLSRL